MVSDFKKYDKQNAVEKFPVTEHRGWILLGTTVTSIHGTDNICSFPCPQYEVTLRTNEKSTNQFVEDISINILPHEVSPTNQDVKREEIVTGKMYLNIEQ